MNKNTRNIIIAVILLLVLLIEPFWRPIKSAVTGEDLQTGASTQAESDAQTGASPEE